MKEVFNGLKEVEHAEWLLNHVMGQIVVGNLKHNDLIFDEKSEWHYRISVPTFFYKKEYVVIETNIVQTVNLTGHIRVKESADKSRYFEIKQDCSILYTVEALFYRGITARELIENAMALMKMLYTGIKEEKITQIPDKIGLYLLIPEDSKGEIKEALGKSLKALINRPYFFLKPYKIKKEDNNCLTENSETFLEKLDIKLIYWENLIALIESYKARRDINEFYKLCKRNKLNKRYKL
ncbi:MAG: hypothetical protein COW66_13210 [Flavobacteriaceae bacterium CG18_big_fil_WC_8_21_14_2_50_34_36]|nr:MAG: hypothetical protein COW66_13210 [Flavobacteriaceae bacterium CG18_big_fil_WC_8_21_14_2_50_34_36]